MRRLMVWAAAAAVCEGVVIDSHACSFRKRSSCWFASEQMDVSSFCGGFCPESEQCVDWDVQECPLGESFKRQKSDGLLNSGTFRLSPCEELLAPECTVARTELFGYYVCRGFCVPKTSDGFNWKAGVCTSIGHACNDTLITKLEDVPCSARSSCFSCFFAKWGKLAKVEADKDVRETGAKEAGPDCQWCAESASCVVRDAGCPGGGEIALAHHGHCPDET